MANEIPTNDGMNIETLKIDIDVSAKKGSSDIENFEKAVSRLEKSLETLNKALSSSEKSMGKFGNQAKKTPKISIYNANTSSVGGSNAESIMRKIDREKLIGRNKIDAEIAKKFNQPVPEKSSILGRWGKDDFAEAAKNAKMVSDSTDSARRHIEKYSEELGDIINTYTVIDGQVTKIDSKTKKVEKSLTLGSWGKDNFSEAAKNAKLVSDSTNAAGKHIEKYSEELGDIINTYTVIDGQVTKIDSKIKKVEKSSTKTNNIWKSIGHVLKYRLISSAFNLISKGLTDGVEKAALFDDRINDSISNIIGSSKQLTNQIGAAGGELIVSFEPVIVRLIEWLTIGADKVTQFFAALNGKDTYDKAVTQAYDFAKSIRGAYGGIGIDELNIFGSGADGGLLSDVQYVEESLDGWAQGISEFRKEMQPTVDWVNKNLDAVLATAISIGTTIGAIKFADTFLNALNIFSATSAVQGSKKLLTNLESIAGIGLIGIGIAFQNDDKENNNLLGSLTQIVGTGVLFDSIVSALGLASKAATAKVSIPVTIAFSITAILGSNEVKTFLDKAKEEIESFQKNGWWAELLSFPGEFLTDAGLFINDAFSFGKSDTSLPTSFDYSKPFLSDSPENYLKDTDNIGIADYSSQASGESALEYQVLVDILDKVSQISSKNPNIILADDDIGRAYERYVYSRGVPMNGGAYANAD